MTKVPKAMPGTFSPTESTSAAPTPSIPIFSTVKIVRAARKVKVALKVSQPPLLPTK